MNTSKLSRNKSILAALFLLLSHSAFGQQTAIVQTSSAKELIGLWEAKRRFGPDVRGTLLIRQTGGGWQAEIAGRFAPVKLDGDSISFELTEGKGKFQAKFDARRTKIVGHWIQPNAYASPITLTKDRQNVWRGEVSPLDDELTFYLMIKARDDGATGAFLRNPERNFGFSSFIRVDQIEREGDAVKLLAANTGNQKGRVLAEGKYDADNKILSIYFPTRGVTFDFLRVGGGEASDFYPRGRPTVPYVYAPPPQVDDGWQTASLETVGISRDGIQKFIQMIIDTPIDSVSSPEIHGILIARHGKLVLEEYFHGENRDKLHDTRSAGKSLTSTLLGAAVKAGVPVSVSTPVYQAMNGGFFAPDLDPRKKSLTVENLLTMSSGLDCDDADPKSPGGEDYMQNESGATDFYKFTLDLKMIRNPGEKAVYCSVQPNLVGGVLSRVAKQSLPVLFQNLLAEPLQIKRYDMNLAPNGDAYMGGGVRFLLRDFMKLGQLHLNGGVWSGRKILTPEWSRRATSPLYELRNQKYGYFWWVMEFPYKGRTVRAFYAGGNGGQVVIGIPELDLVIAFYGGNYNDPVLFVSQRVYVPQYILPAIDK